MLVKDSGYNMQIFGSCLVQIWHVQWNLVTCHYYDDIDAFWWFVTMMSQWLRHLLYTKSQICFIIQDEYV